MRETFTLMIALMLSVEVNAQTKLGEIQPARNVVELSPELSVIKSNYGKSNAPLRKIKIDEGEHLMGFYTSDDLPIYGVGFEDTGAYSVANLFGEEVLSEFVDGQIMRFRFAITEDAYVYSAFIYSVNSSNRVSSEPLAYVGINDTFYEGWNDIELSSPVTIEEDTRYLIGYSYEQTEINEYTGSGYTMGVDYGLERDIVCNYFYGYDGPNNQWSGLSGAGALCIQAVVKGGSFIDDDITLKNLSTNKYAPQGNDMDYSLDIRNHGNYFPESYELKVAIDGEEVETLTTPISLTSSYQTISGTFSTSGLSIGSHTLSVSVDKINDETPTENIGDDVVETSFVLYSEGETVERQMHVIEQFTSIYCGYCPRGHDTLEKLMANNPNKYAWVALHGYGMGADPYCIVPGYYYVMESFSGASSIGYPTASVSRALLTNTWLGLDNDMAFGIGYATSSQETAAQNINQAVDEAYEDVPAFVSVDITPEYDSYTRELTITVKGEGASSAKQILDGNRLTIYLTEDGIEGIQENYDATSTWIEYTHDNVLRAIVNEYEWGDDISWTSDSSYSNTVKTTLDSDWDDSQIYITAFISGPMAVLIGGAWYYGDTGEGLVNNANRVKATDVPAGISAVAVNPEGVTKTYYTSDGRQLSAPMKGVNIVKSSDGTVKKLYVK